MRVILFTLKLIGRILLIPLWLVLAFIGVCVRSRKRGDRSREIGSADERIPAIYEGKSERNYSLYRRVNT